MREQIRHMIEEARRSGDRIGVEGKQDTSTRLAAEAIRLARLATSIHMTRSARIAADGGSVHDRALSARQTERI